MADPLFEPGDDGRGGARVAQHHRRALLQDGERGAELRRLPVAVVPHPGGVHLGEPRDPLAAVRPGGAVHGVQGEGDLGRQPVLHAEGCGGAVGGGVGSPPSRSA